LVTIHIYMKCHKETLCVAMLNKKKCHFFLFFYKIVEQEDRTVLPVGIDTSGRGEEVGERV
jgi:hypothetical protein